MMVPTDSYSLNINIAGNYEEAQMKKQKSLTQTKFSAWCINVHIFDIIVFMKRPLSMMYLLWQAYIYDRVPLPFWLGFCIITTENYFTLTIEKATHPNAHQIFIGRLLFCFDSAPHTEQTKKMTTNQYRSHHYIAIYSRDYN